MSVLSLSHRFNLKKDYVKMTNNKINYLTIVKEKKLNNTNLKSNNKMPHPDQKYINALRNNDNILIREIYQKWYTDVEIFVLKNSGTKDQAKALFQEALTKLWEKATTTKIELTVPFGAYFYKIYRFKWLNYISRDKARKHIDSSIEINDVEKYADVVMSYFNVDTENITEKRLQVFNECFKKLGENHQKILTLKFEGKKAEEIKKITGKPSSNSVYAAIHGCCGQLKKLIKKHPEFKTLYL